MTRMCDVFQNIVFYKKKVMVLLETKSYQI